MNRDLESLIAFYQIITDKAKAEDILKQAKAVYEQLAKAVNAKATLDTADKYLDKEKVKLAEIEHSLAQRERSVAELEKEFQEHKKAVVADFTAKSVINSDKEQKLKLLEVTLTNKAKDLAQVEFALNKKAQNLQEKQKELEVLEAVLQTKSQKLKDLLG